MEEQFKQYNIKNYKRVPAFDGRKLFSDSSLRAKTVELPKDMKQSSGEIGCSLSHLRAAEMALEIDAPYVLVMEDDIHLTFYERRAARRFMKVPSLPCDSSPGVMAGGGFFFAEEAVPNAGTRCPGSRPCLRRASAARRRRTTWNNG